MFVTEDVAESSTISTLVLGQSVIRVRIGLSVSQLNAGRSGYQNHPEISWGGTRSEKSKVVMQEMWAY